MIDNYMLKIQKMKFKPVTEKIFKQIQTYGLDKKVNRFEKSEWEYAELKLTEEDALGLIKYDLPCIKKFGEFDRQLQKKYKMSLIDLIDYEHGKVYIGRWK